MDWNQLLGPSGVAVGAVLIAVFLARLHFADDKRRDLELEGWKQLYLATFKLAEGAVARQADLTQVVRDDTADRTRRRRSADP